MHSKGIHGLDIHRKFGLVMCTTSDSILLSITNDERWKDEAAQVDLMERGSAGGGRCGDGDCRPMQSG